MAFFGDMCVCKNLQLCVICLSVSCYNICVLFYF